MSDRKRAALGLESLDFQGPAFFKELILAFEMMAKLTPKDFENPDPSDSADPSTMLSAIVKNHTGMKVMFDIGQYDPCVELPQVDRNHPLLTDWRAEWSNSKDGLAMIKDAKGFARGGVNINTGKVTGVFAELQCTIHLPAMMVTGNRYTPEECASVTAHEIGHLFVYFEFIARQARTNQVLAGIARALDGTSTQKEREVVLLSAKQALNLKDLDTTELAKVSDQRVIETVIVTQSYKTTESEIGSAIYDENNFEMLADQYVARLGGARALVTALGKLYKDMNHIATRSTAMYLFWEAIKLGFFIAVWVAPFGPGYTTITIAGTLIHQVFWQCWGMLSSIMLMTDAVGTPEYDRPHIRLKRMRNQLTEQLKVRRLPKEQYEAIEADIRMVDGVLDAVKDRIQILGVLALAVGVGRARFNAEKIQQELESLAANDLFGKSHALRNA